MTRQPRTRRGRAARPRVGRTIASAVLVTGAAAGLVATGITSRHTPSQAGLAAQQAALPLPGPVAAGVPGAGNCVLIIPADPLSAQGLATPYQLTGPQGASPQASGCTMANAANLGAFAQATIVEPGGHVAEYDPLVITMGTTPAVTPPVPVIPPGSVITIDTGFQGNILTDAGPGGALFDQGLPGSPFGQVAFANGPAFFAAARAEGVKPPVLGVSPADGQTCPTVHDFSLVDQDPSDNVTTQYLVTGTGQTALDTPANAAALPGATPVNNGSDNLLLDHFVDPAIGCQGSEFTVPSLSSPGTTEATQATDELLADANQHAPVALVPPNDPMTTVGADADINAGQQPTAANLSLAKTDLYRAGVGQHLLLSSPVQAAISFCRGLQTTGAPRLAKDAPSETGPSPAAGMTLAQFLAQRYANSLTLLNCALFGGVTVPTVPVGGSAAPASSSSTAATQPAATPSAAAGATISTPAVSASASASAGAGAG
jgi:hypothetical protein